MKKLEVAEETKALAVAGPSNEMVALFKAQAQTEDDDFGSNDLSIPYLAIIQKQSPQCDEASGKYIDGAKPGMVFNSVTQELYDTLCLPNRPEPNGITVVPSKFEGRFVEWIPKDNGGTGGFVARYAPDDPIINKAKPNEDKKWKLTLPNGNDLVETDYYYVMIVTDSGPEWAVVAMASTQLTIAKKWNTRIKMTKLKTGAPMTGQVYVLHTIPQTNAYGSWFGWRVKTVGVVESADLFEASKAFRAAISSGTTKLAAPPTDGDGSDNPAPGGKEEIPF